LPNKFYASFFTTEALRHRELSLLCCLGPLYSNPIMFAKDSRFGSVHTRPPAFAGEARPTTRAGYTEDMYRSNPQLSTFSVPLCLCGKKNSTTDKHQESSVSRNPASCLVISFSSFLESAKRVFRLPVKPFILASNSSLVISTYSIFTSKYCPALRL